MAPTHINRQLWRINDAHEVETGERLKIDVVRTMANIFGCPWPADPEDIEKLCELSDLAANVHYELVNDDLDAALFDLKIRPETFIADFVEFE